MLGNVCELDTQETQIGENREFKTLLDHIQVLGKAGLRETPSEVPIKQMKPGLCLKTRTSAGDGAQQLRTLSALPEDLSLVHSSHNGGLSLPITLAPRKESKAFS